MKPPIRTPPVQELESVLLALALSKPPEERSAFLDAVSGNDLALRQRLAAQLAREEPSGLAVEAGTTLAGSKATEEMQPVEPADEAVGQTFGRYKLLERVGEGGYGVVYVAEQTEPIRRRVALKVIKLGMDTKQVVARFEAERQALALMDHPNIAKVLDAGITALGRPYFVMELVRGIRLTDYCDQASLTTRERIELFIKVCRAIQHAHQKGIIHRDIKPSNILVTLHDGVPVPKVIDFGIAKATEGRLTDRTVYTELHQFIGTPAYMSPEQAEMSGLDVDTRSDIYSLGVVLYELLAGSTPFDGRELVASGIDGMRRTIRELEPVPPSTRVASLGGEHLSAAARRRSSDSLRLVHQLKGDLDWIVMKCLEKDRTRRYETANGLALDLTRHLNNEVVTARPASTAYRLRKLIRRNRRGALVVATVATLLVVGIAVTTRLAVLATRARDLAAREAVRSAEVAEFLKDLLESAGPSRARGRDTTMLREILDSAAQRMGNRLKSQPEVEFELSGIMARTYLALGAFTEAERLQRAALDLATPLYGPSHTNIVTVLEELGGLLDDVGRTLEATNVLHRSVAMARGLVGEDHPLTAGAMRRLGVVYADLGKYADAERLLLPATQTLMRQCGPEDPRTLHCRQSLTSLYFRQGRLADMEQVALDNLTHARHALGNDDPLTITLSVLVAVLRQEQGRFEEAEALHSAILASKRRILGEEHPNTLLSLDYLSVVLGYEGRFVEAEALTRSALDTLVRSGKGQGARELSLRNNHAEHLRNLGRHVEAEAEFQKALDIGARTTAPDDPLVLEIRRGLAILRELQGRRPEAEVILRDLVRIRQAGLPADDRDLADSRAQLARILLADGRAAEAEPLARESLAVFKARDPDDWRRFAGQSLVGGCRLAAGDSANAETLLREGHEGLAARASRIPAIDQFRVREALERLVKLAEVLNRPAESARWRHELEQFVQSPAGRRLTAAQTSRQAP